MTTASSAHGRRTFVDLAERRAWLDSLPDTDAAHTVTPTEKRLKAANDNVRLTALAAADVALAPPTPVCVYDRADDTVTTAARQPGNGWRMRPEEGEWLRGLDGIEMRHRLPPVLAGGRRAARIAAGEAERGVDTYPATTIRGDGTQRIGPFVFTETERSERAPIVVEGKVVNGSVDVTRGTMIERGRTRRGSILKPAEYRTFEKPAPARRRSRTAIRSYLALRGWPFDEQWLMPEGGEVRERPHEKQKLSDTLAAYGVDGSVDFHTARANAGLPPADRGPDAIWWEGDWLGGASACHGGGARTNEYGRRAEIQSLRAIIRAKLLANLGETEVQILKLATSSARAKDAGDNLGMTRQRYTVAANDVIAKVAVLLAA